MMDPNTHGQLMLAMLRERLPKRNLALSIAINGSTTFNRIIASLGGLLIKLGMKLTHYSDPESINQTTALVIEAK